MSIVGTDDHLRASRVLRTVGVKPEAKVRSEPMNGHGVLSAVLLLLALSGNVLILVRDFLEALLEASAANARMSISASDFD
jgi:hypothetical protein